MPERLVLPWDGLTSIIDGWKQDQRAVATTSPDKGKSLRAEVVRKILLKISLIITACFFFMTL